MLTEVCYEFSAINPCRDKSDDDTQVLAVDVCINHSRSSDLDWDASLAISVRSRVDKKWRTEDFGLDPFNKETAIALRDFLIFCFPLRGKIDERK